MKLFYIVFYLKRDLFNFKTREKGGGEGLISYVGKWLKNAICSPAYVPDSEVWGLYTT